MKKFAIDTGSVFLVPIAPAVFAIGVVISADGRGRAVGAFFGPTVSGASEVDASKLELATAVLVCRFGDQGLYTKRWPVIGSIPNWDRVAWSVTRFVRRHDNPDLCYITEYDEALDVISEDVVSAFYGNGLPEDAQYGSGVVEAKLAKLLR